MTLNRGRLYTILFIACFAGYIWLYLNISETLTGQQSFNVCLIKQVTNIPCPSCGSTRSIISLSKGQLMEAFSINPLGIVVAIIMLFTPIWVIIDLLFKRKTLLNFYQQLESLLQQRKYAIPLGLLVILNWVWNIVKGL